MVINEQHIKTLGSRLAKRTGHPLHQVHEAIAVSFGFKNWNALKAQFKSPHSTGNPSAVTAALIEAASAAYGDDAIAQAYDRKTNHVTISDSGDTLAEFIAAEIRDVSLEEDNPASAASNVTEAIERAGRKLLAVAAWIGHMADSVSLVTLHQCQATQTLWTEAQILPVRDMDERVSPGEEVPSGESPESGAVTHKVCRRDPDGLLKRAIGILDNYHHVTGRAACLAPRTGGYEIEYHGHGSDVWTLPVHAKLPAAEHLDAVIGKKVPSEPRTREGHGPDCPLDVTLGRICVEFIQKKNDGTIVLLTEDGVVRLDEFTELEKLAVLDTLAEQERPKLSTAFGVAPDDVFEVLRDKGMDAGFSYAEALFARHIEEHAGAGGRIEKAALHGNELHEQTRYAHEEIEAILREDGVLT